MASSVRRPKLPPLVLDASFPPPKLMAFTLDPKEVLPQMNEKEGLPCVMVTPSSPTEELDMEVYYFTMPKGQPSFLSTLTSAFAPSTQSIALPTTQTYNRRASSQSLLRRLRTFILLAIPLFLILHLFLLPSAEHGLYKAFAHQGEFESGSPKVWHEGVTWTEDQPPSSSFHRISVVADFDDHPPSVATVEVEEGLSEQTH